MLPKMPGMRAKKKRHILLVLKDCDPCEDAKKEFATKYFGYGEIIDAFSPEGKRLLRDPRVGFEGVVPLEVELDEDQ